MECALIFYFILILLLLYILCGFVCAVIWEFLTFFFSSRNEPRNIFTQSFGVKRNPKLCIEKHGRCCNFAISRRRLSQQSTTNSSGWQAKKNNIPTIVTQWIGGACHAGKCWWRANTTIDWFQHPYFLEDVAILNQPLCLINSFNLIVDDFISLFIFLVLFSRWRCPQTFF